MNKTSLADDWHEYETRNRHVNHEYQLCPSIVADILNSLERDGLGRARRFDTTPAALFAWFPDLIERSGGGDRFQLRFLPLTEPAA